MRIAASMRRRLAQRNSAVGRPGTGKTYTLGVARHAFQLGGYRALAAAPPASPP
jgi:hypothetical protein